MSAALLLRLLLVLLLHRLYLTANRRMAVLPAAPQPPAPDGSVPRQRTAGPQPPVPDGSDPPPDLNLRMAVFPAGPQPRVRRYAR